MSEEAERPPAPTWSGPVDEQKRPHGQGVMSYPPPPLPEGAEEEEEEQKPGDSYEGSMQNGVRHGRGRYTFGASGAVFDGHYVDGRRQGEGAMRFPDRSRYEGGWAQDQLEGQGVYHYANGDVYEGAFKGSKKHGPGHMYFKAQGCMLVGVWSDGHMVEGKWVHQDGTTFQGSFAEGSVPREGSYTFSGTGMVHSGRYSREQGWLPTAAPTPA